MRITKKAVRAAEDIDFEEAQVNVEAPAEDLLFETSDVAELISEVTDKPVEVSVDEEGSAVTFNVDGDEYVVEPEEDLEVVESSIRFNRNKKAPVRANRAIRRPATRRPTTASTRRPVRRPAARRNSK